MAGLDEPRDDACSAKLKREPGKFCPTRPMRNGRCRMHGGATPAPGPDHPNYMHGRSSSYKKALGKHGDAYEEAKQRDDLFDLRRQLAVMDVAVQAHAKRMNELDTPDFRRRALDLYREARDSEDPDIAAKKLRELGQLLGRGVSEDAAFERLVNTADKMARRIESAWNIKLRGDEVVNAQELAVVVAALVNIMAEEAPHDVAARIIERADRELFADLVTAPTARADGSDDGPRRSEVADEVPGP